MCSSFAPNKYGNTFLFDGKKGPLKNTNSLVQTLLKKNEIAHTQRQETIASFRRNQIKIGAKKTEDGEEGKKQWSNFTKAKRRTNEREMWMEAFHMHNYWMDLPVGLCNAAYMLSLLWFFLWFVFFLGTEAQTQTTSFRLYVWCVCASEALRRERNRKKTTRINKHDVWITRHFSAIDVGLSLLFFGFSHTALNCNALEIHDDFCAAFAWYSHNHNHAHCLHIERSLRCSCCYCAAKSRLLVRLLWHILCPISSASCHRCIWVIIFVAFVCVTANDVHFCWLPSLRAKPKKKPISFWMCISFM